jgi:trehalose/maltose hydrolase-like predicted phosphorylase
MNKWEKIKKALEQENERPIVVIDNDDVFYQVKKLDWDKEIKKTESTNSPEAEEVNKNIEQWNSAYDVEESSRLETGKEGEDVKVEDLPF